MGQQAKSCIVNDEQCEGCVYYRLLDGMTEARCCHHLLDTMKARKRDEDGNCLSKAVKKKRKGRGLWAK